MKVFLVKKEFAVNLSTTTFCLHEGDIAYSKNDSKGVPYFYMVEYNCKNFDGKESRHKFNIPLNLNESVWIHKIFKRKKIKDILSEGYIEDITAQYNREAILKMLL